MHGPHAEERKADLKPVWICRLQPPAPRKPAPWDLCSEAGCDLSMCWSTTQSQPVAPGRHHTWGSSTQEVSRNPATRFYSGAIIRVPINSTSIFPGLYTQDVLCLACKVPGSVWSYIKRLKIKWLFLLCQFGCLKHTVFGLVETLSTSHPAEQVIMALAPRLPSLGSPTPLLNLTCPDSFLLKTISMLPTTTYLISF